MRVLFVLFPSDSSANGSMESITELLGALSHVEPLIVTHRNGLFAHRWRQMGLTVHILPLSYSEGEPLFRTGVFGFAKRLWSYCRTNLEIATLARRHGCRVVHCNELYALWHSAIGCRILGRRVLLNLRDTKPTVSKGLNLKASLAFLLSDHRVTLSREMSEFWRGAARLLPAPGKHTNAVYSAVDLNRFVPVETPPLAPTRQARLLTNKFVLGYVATFKPKKNQERLLRELVAPLMKRMPNLHVMFLGDFDPLGNAVAKSCLTVVQEEGLAHCVEFLGYVTDTERWYPLFDLTLVATQHEGLARCMIESLACGTPVISFDVCSAKEILETHQCGHVVPAGDYAAMAAKVIQLAGDPVARSELGHRARRAAEQLFEPAKSVKVYEYIYSQLART